MSVTETSSGTLRYLTSSLLPVPHCFTTRLGGVSEGFLASLNLGMNRGDDPENVLQNYRILGRAVGFDPARTVTSKQVHGKAVRRVTEADCGSGVTRETGYECDALITDVPGIPLAVFSADCATALLYEPVRGVAAAVHSGWRGTALGIVKETVEAMADAYGCRPENIRAALGPCIGPCCFETGEDVPGAMRAALGPLAEPAISRRDGSYYVNMNAINQIWLELAGVPSSGIDVSNACTACRPDLYWSYRKHGERRGSLASIICLPDAEERAC